MVLRVSHVGAPTTLTLPPGVSLSQARAFLVDQESWIRGHLSTQKHTSIVLDGTVLPFRGGTLTVRAASVSRVSRVDDTLLIPARAPVGTLAAVWMREEARRSLVSASERYAARLGVSIGRVSLRDPRSRWGSCSHAADLMYSWRLIMAPPDVLDYVAAHEVAHIVELNHSAAFWDVVSRLFPDYAVPRDWLRTNGSSLHRIDFGTRA